MKFYSAWYCPFAQRACMTLLLKAIDFEYIEVDPYDESDWWLSISRGSAKVPVLVVSNSGGRGETTVIDSSRILEYLDDLVPDQNPLLPGSPAERAEQRYWMDWINGKIVPYMYRFLQANEGGEYRDLSKKGLIEGVRHFASEISGEGPFFRGSDVTAADILMAPFAYRIEVLLGHYRAFDLPGEGQDFQKYRRWYLAMLEHPVFRATSTDHDNYRQRLIDFYLPYSQGEAQKDVTRVD